MLEIAGCPSSWDATDDRYMYDGKEVISKIKSGGQQQITVGG